MIKRVELRRKPEGKGKGLEAELTEAPAVPPEIGRIAEVLAAMPCSPLIGAGEWEQIVNNVFVASGGSDEAYTALTEWMKSSFFFKDEHLRKRWDGCKENAPTGVHANSLFTMAARKAEREKVLEEATHLEDADYNDQRRDLAKKLGGGWGVSKLDEERRKRRKRRKRDGAPAPKPATPPIDELAKAAKDIITSEDVLELLANSIKRTLAGESKSAQLIYLATTTRLFAKPMNVAIKGLSAIGKSHLRDQVLAYIPPEEIMAFTTLTEKALYYLPDDLGHKILSMAEAVGTKESELQDYLLREIISAGCITQMVTVPGERGELPTTHKVVKEGPIMFVTTTTHTKLHPEIETRILSIETDDTAKQTRRVVEKVAEIEGGLSEGMGDDLEAWRAFQRWLAAGECRVVVPYVRALARHPALWVQGVRMRRDFRQVICAIQAHALLHRAHRRRDDKGRIVANIDDYEMVHYLLADRLAQGAGVRLKGNDERVLNTVKELCDDEKPGTTAQGVTTQQIVKVLKLEQSTVNRRLQKLIAGDFVENLTPGKGRTAHYRVTGGPDKIDVLPSPEALIKAWNKERSKSETEDPPHFPQRGHKMSA